MNGASQSPALRISISLIDRSGSDLKSVSIEPGSLESSNVNPIEMLATLMTQSRSYESQVKLIKALLDNNESSSSMMRIA